MNHKLITTHPHYWLLVDSTTDLKIGQCVYYQHPAHTHREGMVTNILNPAYAAYKPYEVQHTEGWGVREGYSVIIAHLPKHDNAPVLEGIPLLPELHTEPIRDRTIYYVENTKGGEGGNLTWVVEAFATQLQAEMYCKGRPHLRWSSCPLSELPKQGEDVERVAYNLIRKGAERYSLHPSYITEISKPVSEYIKANTKKWSDEDMCNFGKFMQTAKSNAYTALRDAMEKGTDGTDGSVAETKKLFKAIGERTMQDWLNIYLQSLSPAPVGFKPETEVLVDGKWYDGKGQDTEYNPIRIKTTKTTFRGKEVEVIQGRWIYE